MISNAHNKSGGIFMPTTIQIEAKVNLKAKIKIKNQITPKLA
jgi:hypothetical protein